MVVDSREGRFCLYLRHRLSLIDHCHGSTLADRIATTATHSSLGEDQDSTVVYFVILIISIILSSCGATVLIYKVLKNKGQISHCHGFSLFHELKFVKRLYGEWNGRLMRFFVVIQRGSYDDFVAGEDLEKNILIQSGDIIIVN